MNNPNTIAATLTADDHAAWLDWMVYVHDFKIGVANDLSLAEPGDGVARHMAEALLANWRNWREQPLEVLQ